MVAAIRRDGRECGARLRTGPVTLLLAALLCIGAAPSVLAQEGLLPVPRSTGGPAASSPGGSQSIDPDVDPAEDDAIARRLRTMYTTIETLAPIQVQVSAGVVVLSGEVSSQAAREQATRLARNVRGVGEVENRIVVAQDLEGRLTPALKRLRAFWTDFVRLLPVLAVGFAIVALAVLVGRWLARRRAVYERLAANAFIAALLAQVVQGTVLVAGVGLTLLLLDATGIVTTLLGAAGLLGLALSFALRDTVENYIASILLSLRRPFDPEDFVRIENHEGLVVGLTSRATVLLTLDGNHVRIPNSTVFKALIVNFTQNPQRRFTFQVTVAADDPLGRIQRLVIAALRELDSVLADPPPTASFQAVGDAGVILQVAGWMDQTTHDFLRVRSEAIRIVLNRMTEAGIKPPEPTMRIRRAPAVDEAESPAPAVPAAMPTDRDRSLDRALEKERARRPNILDRSAPPE